MAEIYKEDNLWSALEWSCYIYYGGTVFFNCIIFAAVVEFTNNKYTITLLDTMFKSKFGGIIVTQNTVYRFFSNHRN